MTQLTREIPRTDESTDPDRLLTRVGKLCFTCFNGLPMDLICPASDLPHDCGDGAGLQEGSLVRLACRPFTEHRMNSMESLEHAPFSRETRAASSGTISSMRSASFISRTPRSDPGLFLPHVVLKALRAIATARSTSVATPSATDVIIRAVAGLITLLKWFGGQISRHTKSSTYSMVVPLVGGRNSLSMKIPVGIDVFPL